MTKEEAIEMLKSKMDGHTDTSYEWAETVRMAIKALEQTSWIPVSERLPEEDTEVIVSCTDDSGDSEFSYTTTGWHFKGMWVVGNERSYFVRAWMPLPEPYKAESEDTNADSN